MSDEEALREPEDLRRECARKLRDVPMSVPFRAILACLLDVLWTSPVLADMVVMSNRSVLGMYRGEKSFSQHLGSADDLIRDIHSLAAVAELDGDEIGYLVGRVAGLRRFRLQ